MKEKVTHINRFVKLSMKRLLFTLLIIMFAAKGFACTPFFTYTPAPLGDDLLRYSFTNFTSYGTIPALKPYSFVRFYFGDGDSVTMTYPYTGTRFHVFPDTGNYTVTLRNYLFDTTGGGSPYCVTDTAFMVHVGYPQAGFTISHAYKPNRVVHFTANCPASTASLKYIWNFGDGSPVLSTIKDTISHTYPTNGTYYVNASDSDSLGTYHYSNMDTVNVIYFPPTSAMISGYIFKDTTFSPSIADYKILLMRYDSLTHTSTLADSFSTSGGFITSYQFNNGSTVTPGQYIIKVTMTNGTGTSFLPTYYGSSTSWSDADIIHLGTVALTNINMTMQHCAPPTTGAGFISGDVKFGAGKGTGSPGDPVPGLLMMLRDAGNKLIAYTYTNTAGHYSFSDLQFGKYVVIPEDMGYTIVAHGGIVLSGLIPAAYNVNFKKTSTTILPTGQWPIEVAEINFAQSFTVSPNPSSGNITINWRNTLHGTMDITVLNTIGQKVYNMVLNTDGTEHANLNLSQLQPGVYYMNVTQEGNNYNTKIIIQ